MCFNFELTLLKIIEIKTSTLGSTDCMIISALYSMCLSALYVLKLQYLRISGTVLLIACNCRRIYIQGIKITKYAVKNSTLSHKSEK